MYLIGPVSGGYHLKLDPAPQPWHLTHLGPPPGIQQFHDQPLQALGEFGVASLPADQHSSFPILEAQHQKDPLKKLRRKFVYVFHNLHIYHLDASKLLNQFKHFLWKNLWTMIRLAKPLSQPAWASSVTSAENSLLCVLHRFCAQTGAGKFTMNIYVTQDSLALHKLTNKCVTVQNRNLHHLIVWNHLKRKVAQKSVLCSCCAQTLEESISYCQRERLLCECTWQESLLCPQTSLSWIIEQWIISRLTCIRSFQLRIIKLPLNPLLFNKSLSWKQDRKSVQRCAR